ncbi:phosphate ABC transporter substrate-binding protein [Desulfonatronospira sp.]|uniref:phosphate ABC transporter substrate-binding protein n=1 Tax=Desulfonatronospira sp. TaxID=1962951 RepID=UPI0025BF8FBF|nr:phosphate ABC transporter substrate-binding protein [Desulfonatronospira sp.]
MKNLCCAFMMTLLMLGMSEVTHSEEPKALHIAGATTIQPVLESLAGDYERKTGQKVHVQGGGSSTGIEHTAQEHGLLGAVSRALKQEEKKHLEYTTIGLDALVFIVNERNPLQEIDRDTVIRLFTGEITSWNQLSDWDRPVVLVSKEMGRSTLDLFEEYTGVHHPDNPVKGENGQISAEAYEIASNLDGATLAAGLPGAVSYLSLGTSQYLQNRGMPIKILSLEDYPMDRQSIVSGQYPIKRELNLVYRPENKEMVKDFLEFCLGPEGQDAVRQLGYIPVQKK